MAVLQVNQKSSEEKAEIALVNAYAILKSERIRLMDRYSMALSFVSNCTHAIPMKLKDSSEIVTMYFICDRIIKEHIDTELALSPETLNAQAVKKFNLIKNTESQQLVDYWNQKHDEANKLRKLFMDDRISIIRKLEQPKFPYTDTNTVK